MTEATKVPPTVAKPQRNSNRNPKGKKPFKKKGNKKNLPAIKRGDPVFLYTSDCHGVRAGKTPCERAQKDRSEGKFSQTTLGKWKCSQCHHTCKVTRNRNKPVTEETAQED